MNTLRLRLQNSLRAASRSKPFARPARVASTMRYSSSAQAVPNPDPTPASPTGQLVQQQQNFMVATYSRPTPIFERAKGLYLYDVDGRKYLDFTAGIAVTSLGHCDDEIASIIADQSKTLIHTSNLFYNTWTGKLSQSLVEETRSSGGMRDASHAFICNSGSEANEAAIKFGRKVSKFRTGDLDTTKTEIVSFHNSFHGRTMGALSATPNPKYQRPFGPMVPGHKYGTYNDLSSLDLITADTCAVIVEPVQGEGGVHAASESFFTALRQKCDAVNAVLIYDEIQCGLGRTGKLWAHSYLPQSAHPDIITTAKALGNGFPVGATIVNQSVAECIQVGDHGTTFGGNPLASRIGHHCLSRLADPELQAEVVRKGELLSTKLAGLMAEFPDLITEVRGRGLLIGLQLTRDPVPIVTAARERGFIVITAGTNTLRFAPALVVSDEQIETAVSVLRDSIKATLVQV